MTIQKSNRNIRDLFFGNKRPETGSAASSKKKMDFKSNFDTGIPIVDQGALTGKGSYPLWLFLPNACASSTMSRFGSHADLSFTSDKSRKIELVIKVLCVYFYKSKCFYQLFYKIFVLDR